MSEIAQHSAAGLSYLACGDDGGMPIVLLHGIGSNAQSFVPLMRAFEGGRSAAGLGCARATAARSRCRPTGPTPPTTPRR